MLNTCSGIDRSKLWIPSKTRTPTRCMTTIYRRSALLPLSPSVGEFDDGVMALTGYLTVGFISLLVLVAAGRLIDRLYWSQALKDGRRLNS